MSLGFVPEGASSYTFPKVMGKQHANALLLANERLSAQEMYVSGLVTAAISAEDAQKFLEMVCEKAKKIASFNAESLAMAKALTNRLTSIAEEREARIREGHDLKVRLNSDDSKALMKAFTDRAGKPRL